MTAILGVNCFSHDTAACLLVDGQVVAVGEQERFDRRPHTKAFPDDAVAYCLRAGGLGPQDLDAVAVAQRPWLDLARGGADAIRRLAPKRLAAQGVVDLRLLAQELDFRRRYGFRAPLVHVGHHDAHAAAAFFASPFEQAAVLTVDRGGDFLSTTLAVGRGNQLEVLAEIANPDSLGEVYSAITWFLGFTPNADEGKVMGLAPYGSTRLARELAELVHLEQQGRFRVDLRWFGYHREGKPVSRRFLARYGPPRQPEGPLAERDKDLAMAVQLLVEEAGLHLARWLRERSGLPRLCLAGGVALNSVMNFRLLQEAGFEDLWVQPLSSDAGNALGAALYVHHVLRGAPRRYVMEHPFLGPEHPPAAAERALAATGLPVERPADPAARAAELLAAGLVVGWYQGRGEVGPRALGNRSILADPRRAEMRDVVNHRVKRREWFRPFAPAILHERGPDYFVDYRPNPFMTMVEAIRPERQAEIPAVTHVDGTGRLQSVTAGFNPRFRRLIEAFDHLTGVPVVLNTSFNVRGEPMVNTPEEAVADFLRTEMDALVLGDLLVMKPERRRQLDPS
ncbi:carbamoyltransferase [Aciditerrimonas ferrireducens]|uniref:Carbamoyltransferase n=1 Tax=Aciditerrimonas ferrireducens TaxID=667306 RepID=A0ABV6C551_9ACTN